MASQPTATNKSLRLVEMTLTNKHNINKQRDREKHNSRIKQTRKYILDNSLMGLLNNQKWQNVFEWLEGNKIEFKLITLLNPLERNCDFIRELETNSILIDDSGEFIDFLEIKKLTIFKSSSLITFLNESNIEYLDNSEMLDIVGYR